MYLSICLSTYNRVEYVKYTVGSILDQFFSKEINFEIVVCDGGSTDGTLEYLRSLKNVRVFEIGMIGLAKSYIYAFKQASGKYIVNINDHMYINISNVMKCLNDLDDANDIGCVMYTLSAYGFGLYNRKPFEFPDYSHRINGLMLHHLFIFRKKDVYRFDQSYYRNWWDFDFIAGLLINGQSIGLYKYVFGCELKLDDNYGGILCEQRKNDILNNSDAKYFKKKYRSFINEIHKNNKITIKQKINRLALRVIHVYLSRFVDIEWPLLLVMKDELYAINRIPTCEIFEHSIKGLSGKKYNKTISLILFNALIVALYGSVNNALIYKYKTKNFYLIQSLIKH